MNDDTIKRAVEEAKRFIDRVELMKQTERNDERESPKCRGAVRRASMDLTRALADMRRPG